MTPDSADVVPSRRGKVSRCDDTDEGPQFVDVIDHENLLIFSNWWTFPPPAPG